MSSFCPTPIWRCATQIISDSAFGCAGQRCLAVSVAVTVGEAQKTFRDSIADAASSLKVGNGLEEGVQMGPVITPQSKSAHRISNCRRRSEGAKVVLDGRNAKIPNPNPAISSLPPFSTAFPADPASSPTRKFSAPS